MTNIIETPQIDEREAKNILRQHKIELDINDPRNALQFLMELAVYIEQVPEGSEHAV